MSTEYYALREPVRDMKIEDKGDYLAVKVHVGDNFVGLFTGPRDGDGIDDLVYLFRGDLVATTFGRPSGDIGIHWHTNVYNWRDDTVLVCEYGDLVTLRDLKRKTVG